MVNWVPTIIHDVCPVPPTGGSAHTELEYVCGAQVQPDLADVTMTSDII